jgi:hypothetical protein
MRLQPKLAALQDGAASLLLPYAHWATILDGMRVRPPVLALRLLASLVVVAGITFICSRVIPVNATTAGFAFLLGILAIAATWGLI